MCILNQVEMKIGLLSILSFQIMQPKDDSYILHNYGPTGWSEMS